MSEHDLRRARRYLLGDGGEEERAVFEQEYLADANALEHLDAAEEHLIEDFLAERLDQSERSRFEQSYLRFPHRRRRVETIRALMGAAERERVVSVVKAGGARPWAWAAAASVVLALGGWWMLRPAPSTSVAVDRRVAAPASSAPPAPSAPSIFSMAISPVAVRSAGDQATLVIPSGTGIVRLRLEGDGSRMRLDRARARVRTVAGADVWSGPAEPSNDAAAGPAAQIDVPAVRLPVDDYVIELFGADATGVERERARYFLSVRPR